MNDQNHPSLEEAEQQVKRTTVVEQAESLKLVEKLLNAYLGGFRELEPFTPREDNKLEAAWSLLAIRAFNSFRCAYELLQRGYYTQALTLIRSANEDWLTYKDCKTNPETLDFLLLAKGKGPSFSAMAKRQGEDFSNLWQEVYGLLSTFAHPRSRALAALVDHEDGRFRIGGYYNTDLFSFACSGLMTAAFWVKDLLVKRTSTRGESTWVKKTKKVISEVESWKEKMKSRAPTKLQERQESSP